MPGGQEPGPSRARILHRALPSPSWRSMPDHPSCLACSLASARCGVRFPCGGAWRWATRCGPASSKPKLIPLSFDVDFFFFHFGPDIQLGKLQLATRPPPAPSSHANGPGHTQWHSPAPATGLRRAGGQRQLFGPTELGGSWHHVAPGGGGSGRQQAPGRRGARCSPPPRPRAPGLALQRRGAGTPCLPSGACWTHGVLRPWQPWEASFWLRDWGVEMPFQMHSDEGSWSPRRRLWPGWGGGGGAGTMSWQPLCSPIRRCLRGVPG